MERTILLIIILFSVVSCKTDNNKNVEDIESNNSLKQNPISTFEESLLDVRTVNEKFTDQYQVEKFGIKKQGDSLIGFVFKLDDNTTSGTVEAYSLGIRVFDKTLEEPLAMSFNPFLEEIEGHKYVIVKRVITETKYFDSISTYIYKRKDWKGSGRLGGFKINDIFFEDKKQ